MTEESNVKREAGNPGHISKYQAVATVAAVGAIQNEWQWVLGTGNTAGVEATNVENVRIYDISTHMTVANETIEIKITIDGQTIDNIANGVAQDHSSEYQWYKSPIAISGIDSVYAYKAAPQNITKAFLVEGSNVSVAIRKTTATGLNDLHGIVTYGVLKPAN